MYGRGRRCIQRICRRCPSPVVHNGSVRLRTGDEIFLFIHTWLQPGVGSDGSQTETV
jgi:hypothetical protein